jgi:ribosomal protein S18 acetylase RimI-like enzyme
MSAGVVGLHHDYDRHRFLAPRNTNGGYGWWLAKESMNPAAIVLVAERVTDGEPQVIGYTYGTLETMNWALLLGPHGGLHDVWVDPEARRTGAGHRLVEATLRRFDELGTKQVILMTAVQNETARKLFSRFGFRQTMIEMTREAE